MLKIRHATPEDFTAISVVAVSAFEQPNEARLMSDLRDGGHVAIEMVASDEDMVVGCVMLSRLELPQEWLTLAPLCIIPSRQRQGIGAELVRYALDEARRQEFDAVVVVGDPDYYVRFGFEFDGFAQLFSPYPPQYTGLYPIDPQTSLTRAELLYPAPFLEV
ncbi:GNAT family N-acetyltransferase [Qingshengfaniella alkalisoli]|uniref:N-acetyltransferase n=1 Tax=Qingshengfaniella alkalisoli TaxID=2599296 RepID=A0A5B8I588_9RHOB|nr:N-acetyltransferase [Qingshengfaniella alkalisoli]QDY68449.1 N-acetyltransferase [Qingshengfaniella alkalisoli]